MDSTVLAIRAVTATYAKQLLWPALYVWVAIYAGIFAVSYWLAATFHPLWWLLVLMLSPLFVIGVMVWGFCFAIAARIHPVLTSTQKRLARDIVSHISHIAEELGTPKFVILGRLVKDTVFSSSFRSSYIGTLTAEPGEARHKFEQLRKSF